MFGRAWRRLRYWMKSGERARLLREEMETHLEMRVEELMDAGMAESDARGAARRHFGNLTLIQEESRATWIARWLGDLMQDMAFAVRTTRTQPGFALVAILSAALGIGACSLIFGIANFALFRPLPVSDPSRLVSVSGRNLTSGRVGQSLSYPDFEDLRQARSFAGMTAFFQFMPVTISSNGEPQRYWGSMVTADYFDVVRPAFIAGRGFDRALDDRPGQAPAVVLGYRLWRSRFGEDRSIVGQNITLNNQPVSVVGVTGPGFQGTEAAFFSDLWLPFSMADSLADIGVGARLRNREGQWLMAAARLRDGITEKQAAAEIEVIGARLKSAYPATNKTRAFHIERAGQVNAGFRRMIVVLFAMLLGVATLVLCTACANVANLLLARASARQKEIATRLAIGAGRSRLVRQLLTESVTLAIVGGICGYAFARLGAAAIGRSRIPLALPVDFSVSLDSRVMLFSVALAALTGVIFGLAPALRATRPDLTGELKEQPVQFGRSRRFGMRNLLVMAQVAICMVLLICSGLFLRSLSAAYKTDTGLAHRNVLMLAFDPSMNRHSPAETRRIVNSILEGTRAIPEVESVSLTSSVPLSMEGTRNSLVPEGPGSDPQNPIVADIYSIAPRFFETLGIRVVDGEDFRDGTPAGDIAIVNQALADKAFPKQNPIGRRILYFSRRIRIIGLVATTKSRSIGEDPRPCLYLPISGNLRGNDSLTGMTLVLRTRGDPAGYIAVVRQAIRTADPALAVFDVRTMDQHLSQALFFPRTVAFIFGLTGFMGLLIATMGVYGVISYSAARRTREIGIRMALGARRGQVLAGVLTDGLTLTIFGSVFGLGVALALSRVAASLLYGVSPRDTLTFIGVPAILLLVTLMACLVPARRAASLDPIRALRYE